MARRRVAAVVEVVGVITGDLDVVAAPAPGRIYTAVEADLSRMEKIDAGVRGSLAEMARVLAIQVDLAIDGGVPMAQLVKAMQELRVVLRQISEVRSDSDLAKLLRQQLSTPVRDGAPS